MKRRDFLKLGSATSAATFINGTVGLGALVNSFAGTKAKASDTDAHGEAFRTWNKLTKDTDHMMGDAIVIGAGFAGIRAASILHKQGKKVIVIEANDRIGGRTKTEVIRGAQLDVGGQWVGPQQRNVMRLIRAHSIPTFSMWDQGKAVFIEGENRKEYKSSNPADMPWYERGILNGALNILNRMASTIPIEKPWLAPNAKEWDSQTLGHWIDSQSTVQANIGQPALWLKEVKETVHVAMRMILATDTYRVSLLFALYYIRTAGSIENLVLNTNGAQQDRFLNGTASLINAMAAPFKNNIILSSPVRAIQQSSSDVRVIADGITARAPLVIVAIPPAMASRIDYSPILPGGRDQLTQNMPMGTVVKCMAIYKDPFWRKTGYSGQFIRTGNGGLVCATYDNSPKDARFGVMVGFVIGKKAVDFGQKDKSERRDEILKEFSRFTGKQALSAIDYIDHAWDQEPWARGAYMGFMPPGVLTTYGKYLREPCGRIHWAGTETAREWAGYIDGAIESGDRAAAEVLKRL